MKKIMNNRHIITLFNVGATLATSHDIPAEDAIKFIHFKRAMKKAVEEYQEREKEIAGDEREEELHELLLNEEVKLEGVEPMSFASYHALAKENRAVQVTLTDAENKPHVTTFDPFTIGEEWLQDILWKLD